MRFVSKCIELMGDGCLNNEHFEELGGILKGKLEEHFKNQELRQGESPSAVAWQELTARVALTLCPSIHQTRGGTRTTTSRWKKRYRTR